MGTYDSEVAILTPSTPLNLIMKKGIYSEPSSVRMNWMVFFGQESGLWDLMPWSGCLDAILWTENHMKTTAAHNVHHKVNHRQWGGTFAATFGKLATWVSEMGKDETGLGCWSWMLCKGLGGHTVCNIMAYNPNQSTHTKTKTVYCQHQSYFESRGNFTCLRKAFLRDFELELQQW